MFERPNSDCIMFIKHTSSYFPWAKSQKMITEPNWYCTWLRYGFIIVTNNVIYYNDETSKVKVILWPWPKSLRFNIFKLLFLNNRCF